jgi:hypothetical protein
VSQVFSPPFLPRQFVISHQLLLPHATSFSCFTILPPTPTFSLYSTSTSTSLLQKPCFVSSFRYNNLQNGQLHRCQPTIRSAFWCVIEKPQPLHSGGFGTLAICSSPDKLELDLAATNARCGQKVDGPLQGQRRPQMGLGNWFANWVASNGPW